MKRRSRVLIFFIALVLIAPCSSLHAASPLSFLTRPSTRSDRLIHARWVSRHTPSLPRSAVGQSGVTSSGKDTRRTIVVDVDDTLCTTDYKSVIFGIGADHSKPFAAAAETLRALSLDYDILYLSARPASVAHRTRRWLDANGFPPGRIIGSKTLLDVIDQAAYKRRVLTRLQQEGEGVFVGIGDRPRDTRAYQATGLLTIVVNPRGGLNYQPNSLIFEDWEHVAAFFKQSGLEGKIAATGETARPQFLARDK